MEPINGINIERYAGLCAKMENVLHDKSACAKIAKTEGINKSDWEAAHEGWQARITDPSDMGRTAAVFVAHWKIAKESIK
jgi:hypothetical protein